MKILTDKQYTPEYWEARCGIPTCSEFNNIITAKTEKPSTAMMTYVCKLIADRYSPLTGPPDTYASEAMMRGTEYEDEARRAYRMMTDNAVRQVGFCTTDDGRFGGSPDGLIDPDGCLELKVPLPHTQIGWLLANELPSEYRAQVHGHLIITGRKWCDFFSYSPGLPPLHVRVEPDEFTKKLRECLEQFDALYKDTLEKLNLGEPTKLHEEIDLPAALAQ